MIEKVLPRLVQKLRNGRSEDAFGFSSYVIKYLIDILVDPLTELIILTFMTGVFSSILKQYIIIPIYKKGDSNDPGNYRPIALVPVF